MSVLGDHQGVVVWAGVDSDDKHVVAVVGCGEGARVAVVGVSDVGECVGKTNDPFGRVRDHGF